MKKKYDIAVVILVVMMTIILFSNNFGFKAASRIGSKELISAKDFLGSYYPILIGITAVLLILVIMKKENEKLSFVAGILSSICFGLTILFSGLSNNSIKLPTSSGRISMSIGCYTYLLLAYLVCAKCNENIQKPWKRFAVLAIGILIAIISVSSGKLDGLSVMKEYSTYKLEFHNYFVNHIKMSFKVVIFGVIIGIPLGWIVFKYNSARKIITTVLNTIESIPSLALLSIMMIPLSIISNKFPVLKEYGISGVGETPVFCALFLYSLFYIVNSMYGALKTVDKRYIDVAKGMGMTTLQTFIKIELPIITPIIVSGIRVSMTGTILGITIGSYIGFGGLGKYILQGLNGFAIDIVMLGTIPVMVMVLFFDFIFKSIIVIIDDYRKIKGRVKI